MAKLKITQVRSKNGETKRQIANLKTLGASHDSIGARLKVKGIAVLRVPGIVDGNVVEGDMITAPRMKAPGWRVLECASLDEHFPRMHDVEEHGAEPVADAVPLLGCLYA